MSLDANPPFDADLVIRFEHWTRKLPLGSADVVLGRADECDVQLPDVKTSRRHCRLTRGKDARWLVEDLGSSSGTLVDGIPIQAPTPIGVGQRLRIGSVQLHIEPRAQTPFLSGDAVRDGRNVGLLLRTVSDLYRQPDLDTLLRTVVDRALELAGADRGAVLLSGGGGLEAAVARDVSGQDLPPEQVLTRSIPDRVLESGKPSLLMDTAVTEGSESIPQSVIREELRSVLCVPIPGENGPLGVLYVDGRQPAEAFGPAEMAIFEALAIHGSIAIERARLREAQVRGDRRERRRLQDENEALKVRLGSEVPIGESSSMHTALDLVRRVAPSEATVVLTGETGTGKEVLARYLHRLSPRASGPFIVVDCGAIPENLIESELFGHERGAFTGATGSREGRFREASGGTVFLDEIGELPLLLQTRLLRVLQEKTVQPVGGKDRVPVDVRVVCATHRDLGKRVAEGVFRSDLYYRISVLTIPIPSLKQRGEDVLLLARHFMNRFATDASPLSLTREARAALLSHSWPGNVRELENRVQRSCILARPPYVTQADLGLGESDAIESAAPAEGEVPLPPLQQAREEVVSRFERSYLEEALRRTGGNVSQAAKLASLSRQMLQKLLRQAGIDRSRFSRGEVESDDSAD